MADQQQMTRHEWLAHLADVRGRFPGAPGATLTADEWRDAYLIQIVDRLVTLERKVGDIDQGA